MISPLSSRIIYSVLHRPQRLHHDPRSKASSMHAYHRGASRCPISKLDDPTLSTVPQYIDGRPSSHGMTLHCSHPWTRRRFLSSRVGSGMLRRVPCWDAWYRCFVIAWRLVLCGEKKRVQWWGGHGYLGGAGAFFWGAPRALKDGVLELASNGTVSLARDCSEKCPYELASEACLFLPLLHFLSPPSTLSFLHQIAHIHLLLANLIAVLLLPNQTSPILHAISLASTSDVYQARYS